MWGHLLKQWDLEPFEFTFTAGSGGGDPGSGGGPPAAEEALPPAAPVQLDIRTRTFEVAAVMAAIAARQELKRCGERLSTWHEVGGSLPTEVLLLIDAVVRAHPCPRARREETAELQCIRLREQLDAQRQTMDLLEAEARAHKLTALRAQRTLEAEREIAAARRCAAAELAREECALLSAQLKEQRLAAAAKHRQLQREMQGERVALDERITQHQVQITELERQLLRLTAAMRFKSKSHEVAVARAEQELQRLSEGRIWARVRDEEVKGKKAAAEASAALAEVARLTAEALGRSRKVRSPALIPFLPNLLLSHACVPQDAADKQELYHLRYRVKELEKKVASYHARSNLKFTELEPLTEDLERLRLELEEQRLQTAKFREVAEPAASYFRNDAGFSLAVDLAVAESLTKAHETCRGTRCRGSS